MRLVILTGASGSGKTAIAQGIASERPPIAEVLRFDSIGVPPAEEMVAGWGSGESWQRAMTYKWMARISAMRGAGLNRPVLFEGQIRLAFLREALSSAEFTDARIILVDCSDVTRVHRLTTDRHQAELANPTMMSWAAYLRKEALEANCEVLDTTAVSLRTSVERVRWHLLS
jgi:hypothetical protein